MSLFRRARGWGLFLDALQLGRPVCGRSRHAFERRSLRFLRVILFWRVLACIDWGCAWGRRNRVWRALRMIGILLLAWLRWRRRRGCAGRDHLVKHIFDASWRGDRP